MNATTLRPGIKELADDELEDFGGQVVGGDYSYGLYIVAGYLVYRVGLLLDSFCQGAGLNDLAFFVGVTLAGYTAAAANGIAVAARDRHDPGGSAYRFWNYIHHDINDGVTLATIVQRIKDGYYGTGSPV